MHSLTQLNSYSDEALDFSDDRLPTVVFDKTPATSQSLTIGEGQSHRVMFGCDIIEIVNYSDCQPYLTVNVSAINGATVAWDSIPIGTNVAIVSTGVYSIGPINNLSTWSNVKLANIELPNDYNGFFTYDSTVSWLDSVPTTQSQSWTTAVVVEPGDDLSIPYDFYYSNIGINSVTGVSNVIDIGNINPIYTLTLTPNFVDAVVTLNTTGTSGTSSFNNTTKVLTITGTKTQVNSHLNTLTYTSPDLQRDFVLMYYLTNNTNSKTATRNHYIRTISVQYLGFVRSTGYYTEGNARVISGGPLITNLTGNVLANHTLVISADPVGYVANLSSTGSGATSSWNNTTKELTIVGPKANVNAHIDSITLTAVGDYTNTIILNYSLLTPESNSASRTQNIIADVIDNEIINMNIDRTYIANNVNSIFSTTTPQIDDSSPADTVYTIFFTSSIGEFGTSTLDVSSTYSYTGTKSTINSLFSTIKFYPTKNITSNGTFTYTQFKNGNLQISQVATLLGSAGSYTPVVETLTSSQTYIPSYINLKYGTPSVHLIGGGGGGGTMNYPGGGGGGGGGYQFVSSPTINNQSYSIIIGAGGLGYAGTTTGTGNNGGTTSAFGASATGGGGGGATGGTSGTGYAGHGGQSGTFTPFTGTSYQTYCGGAGGGAGGAAGSSINRSAYGFSGGVRGIAVSFTVNGVVQSAGDGGTGALVNYDGYIRTSPYAGGGSGAVVDLPYPGGTVRYVVGVNGVGSGSGGGGGYPYNPTLKATNGAPGKVIIIWS